MKFKNHWQTLMFLEAFLYGLGLAFMVLALSRSILLAISTLIIFGAIVLFFRKPWRISLETISNFLDEKLPEMENSTGLLLSSEGGLSDLAMLQRRKVQERLRSKITQVQPKVPIKKAVLIFLAITISAFLLHYFNVFVEANSTSLNPGSKESIVFQPLDSTVVKNSPPNISSQKLTVKYPSYSRLASKTTSNMNIKALEGSQVYWSIEFDKGVDSVFMEIDSENYSLNKKDMSYTHSTKLVQSGFYNFGFKDLGGASYLSDLYAIEVLKDEVPEIEIRQLKQYSIFDISENKKIEFNALVSDDYGISDAYIIATVTKGEGESVKFREERLLFGSALKSGSKKLNLKKVIDLDALKMEAGDELYFYIEAIDVKEPKYNRTRSETFFAVIRDTATNQFAVEGTMGTDLMPDYFRSQRQLIIDTEKLISDKSKLSEKEFNFTSNELGYDQKSLRLKYGEFMGDEADSGIQVTQEVVVDQSEEQDEDNPLGEYTHDHDGDNEHNLVDHDHQEDSTDEEKEDPLDTYLHNHDDPEESTLFTQSLKSKLRQAMAEMWDAELHLRLYTPENSLPYQYRALKLIQEIKNSARIYVHRIGFEPPPIKEDKRLTGEIDDVKTFQKTEEVFQADDFVKMRESVTRIAEIVSYKYSIEETDRKLFAAAGNELAVLAIERPGNYLKTLQQLKWLSEKEQSSVNQLLEVQSGLLTALPNVPTKPKKENIFEDEINTLMLKELEFND